MQRDRRKRGATMPPAKNALPIFALDASTTWDDLQNAISGNANYQLTQLGTIIPLLLFAPLTTPDNLDAWVPMKTAPENLLIVSIARKMDDRVLQALQQADAELGGVRHAATCPTLSVDFELPVADVYAQMIATRILLTPSRSPGSTTHPSSSSAPPPPCKPSTASCAVSRGEMSKHAVIPLAKTVLPHYGAAVTKNLHQ